MHWRKSVIGSVTMLMCFTKQLGSLKVPVAPLAVLSRGYTHAKSKVSAESHLYKEKFSKDKESPRAKRKDDKIVVDPKNDYNFRECRIFVDKLPLNANWKDLKDHFKDWGVNFVTISKDPVTNLSKGCGIAQFDSEAQAIRAVEEMNGTVLKGSVLKMWLDRKRLSKEESGGEGRVEKTLHSLPYASKMRGDVKSSKELESFQRERRGREGDLGNRRSSERSPRESRAIDGGRNREEAHRDQRQDRTTTASTHSDIPVAANYKFKATFFQRDPEDKTVLSPEQLNEIEFLVDSRADCRDYGNYENADEIRLRLRNEFRVQCDDVRKSWRVLSPLMADGTPRPNRAR